MSAPQPNTDTTHSQYRQTEDIVYYINKQTMIVGAEGSADDVGREKGLYYCM